MIRRAATITHAYPPRAMRADRAAAYPYVKSYRDRHGRPRYYYRRKYFPSAALPAPDSAEFLAAYEAVTSKYDAFISGDQTPCCLYRHFDKDDNLLYVGISLSALHRLSGHKKESRWFGLIGRIQIEHFPSRKAALAAEARAIRREKPAYNIRGTVAAPKERAA
jgi:hypothetical protein